jgi:hypothetical protein
MEKVQKANFDCGNQSGVTPVMNSNQSGEMYDI